jgi:tetratricopeptide (TPR) repeat protein
MTATSRSKKTEKTGEKNWAYLLVWVVAFLLRGIYLWQFWHSSAFPLLVGDGVTYDAWATRIAGGDWFGAGVFYQAPLYPYFLGALYALFGRDFLAVRMVQIVLGACSCVLLARAGRSLFKKSEAGLLAGFLLAIYPTAIFFDCSIQKSVLDLFFVCALLAVMGKLSERSLNRWWMIAGILLGLLALTRENALVFLPIVLAWLFIAWRREIWPRRLQWAGMLLLGLAIVLIPVGCRNLLAGGEFHLTTAQLGPNFFIGNSRSATGFYQPLREGRGSALFERDDATVLAEQAEGRTLTPSEVSNYWTSKAWNEIHANFSHWLRLVFKKWLLVWNAGEMGDSDDQYTYADWSPLLQVLNRLLHLGTLCPLAALGICLTWKWRKRLWPLYAMILAYAGSVTLFYVFSRYRFPLVPMLIVFAAAGLTSLWDAFRAARKRALWAGVTSALIAAAVCNHTMMSETLIRAETHVNLGNAFMMGGKIQNAIGQYDEALRLNPHDLYAPANLANALMRVGRFEEAVGDFEQALRIDPNDAHAHYNLGVTLCKLGRPEQSIEHFEQALRIEPDFAEAHHILGSVLFDLGRVQEAVGHWEQAIKIKPTFAEAHYNLANAFLRQGRFKEAIGHYEQALENKPEYAQAHYNLGIALEQTGQVTAAIEQYEQAIQLRPEFVGLQKRVDMLRAAARRQQGVR